MGVAGADVGGFLQSTGRHEMITGSSLGGDDNDSDFWSLEEEYQLQLAMAISASNNEHRCDPELEAAKRMSLGFSPASTAQAELVAHRYWVRVLFQSLPRSISHANTKATV